MFAIVMLCICVILKTMSSGKTIAMHLSLWYVVLVCQQYDVCEHSVGSVYIGGIWWSE